MNLVSKHNKCEICDAYIHSCMDVLNRLQSSLTRLPMTDHQRKRFCLYYVVYHLIYNYINIFTDRFITNNHHRKNDVLQTIYFISHHIIGHEG